MHLKSQSFDCFETYPNGDVTMKGVRQNHQDKPRTNFVKAIHKSFCEGVYAHNLFAMSKLKDEVQELKAKIESIRRVAMIENDTKHILNIIMELSR